VFGGLFVAIGIGLADVAALTKSQLPTDLPLALDRLTVALALGGGFGVAAGAALHIADRGPADAPVPASAPGDGSAREAENDSHSIVRG
jgi:hypothetical protein